MSDLVPPRFAGFDASTAIVGRPASYAWEDSIAASLAFLIGRVKHAVCSQDGMKRAHGTRRLAYVRSPGARYVLVTIGLNESADSTTTQTVTVTLSGATVVNTAAPLDGSATVTCPTSRTRVPQEYVRIFDVSALTVGSVVELVVTSAAGSGTSYGVRRVSLYEIPRDSFNPAGAPSTEPGTNPAWGLPGSEIFAGSVSTSGDLGAGTERLLGQLDSARADMRRFVLNVATVEDTTNAWSQASTASYTDLDFGVGGTPKWRTRARRLYAARAAGYTLKIRIRYALNGTTATLRLKSSAGSTYDVALSDTSGAWVSVTGRFALDTSLTSQEDYFYVQSIVGGAGKTLYVSSLAAYDDDVAPSDPLTIADWTSSTQPSALTYTRTGTWWLVSNAAQSALTSYGASTWGVELDALGNAYTPVHAAYSNLLTAPRAYSGTDGNWTALSGSYTTFSGTGPDGTTLSGNHRATLSAGQTGAYYNYGSDTTLVFSAWARDPSGTSTWYPAVEHSATPAYNVPGAFAVTTTWSRHVLLSDPTGGAKYAAPCESGGVTGSHAQDVVLDCLMVVQGLTYAPPFSTGSVGAVKLAFTGTDLVHGSRFDVDLGYVTAYEAATTSAATQYLLYLDANNHLALNSSHKFVLTLGGAAVCTSATQAYAAGAALGTVRVWNRSDSCGFTINGVTVSAASPGTTSAPGTAYVFSNNGSNVFPCKLAGVLLARAT